jgi:hypothetical protein
VEQAIMAYGRLEVYWPDGKIETYLLDTDTVSVGRAEGNSISLDTDSISRYHFSLVHKDGQVTITDLASANGTFVDGLPLKANVPELMGDVEEISVGSLRIIFRQVDENPTLTMHHAEDETQRIERDDSFIRLALDYSHLKVWPASSSSTELSITNKSKETKAFSIQVSGMPSGWLRLTRPEIELDAGETAYVLLNIKPPRRPNTIPQKYQVNIEVAPSDQPSLAVHAFIEVEIKPYSGFGMAVGQQADDNDPVPVFLHNQGSGAMQLSLSAHDRDNALRFHLPRSPLELQAGQRLRVDLSVEAKSTPLTGTARSHLFVVQVKSLDASGFVAASEGVVKLSPRFPIWGLVAAAGIGLSVLIIGLLVLLGALRPPSPLINSVSLNASEIAQGDMLEISVDADSVESFDILVNQTVVQTALPGDQRVFALDTSELSGNIIVNIIGRNGAESASAETNAYVYLPVAIRSFEARPDMLVRYTINTFTVSWDVPNAKFVRISGLSTLSNSNVSDESIEYAAVDSVTIRGIPTDTLQISLYAEDELGTPIESTSPLTIGLIDPTCMAREEIILREGPNEAYQQVGTVPIASQIVVTAQDASSRWLRVQSDIAAWGALESFDCNENFNPVNLFTEHNVPPMPTTAPTQAASLTPAVSPTRGTVGRVTATSQVPVPTVSTDGQ